MTQPDPTTLERDKDVPAWVDMARLCAEICATENTVDAWVKKGILPPPRKRGGKLMWKWKEVDHWLDTGSPSVAPSADPKADEVRDATRRATAA